MSNNSSWNMEEPFVTLDDAIRRLADMKPYKSTEDKKGHDAAIHFRVPKHVTRSVTKIREAGPYETNSDVSRDAFWIGLQVLQLRYRDDPEWQSYSQVVNISNDAAWEANLHQEEKKFVESLSSFCGNGKEARAIEYLEQRLPVIDDERKRILEAELRSHGLAHLLENV